MIIETMRLNRRTTIQRFNPPAERYEAAAYAQAAGHTVTYVGVAGLSITRAKWSEAHPTAALWTLRVSLFMIPYIGWGILAILEIRRYRTQLRTLIHEARRATRRNRALKATQARPQSLTDIRWDTPTPEAYAQPYAPRAAVEAPLPTYTVTVGTGIGPVVKTGVRAHTSAEARQIVSNRLLTTYGIRGYNITAAIEG